MEVESNNIDVSKIETGTVSQSRFTFRDLRLLSQSSPLSPLRVIALVDFDCFYAQCESVRLNLPEDQPLGVQQFLHVIATNYPARAAGLPKVLTAVEARQKCPNIVLQHVPTWREGDATWAYRDDVLDHMETDKSSLDYYRLQSRRAFSVAQNTLPGAAQGKVEKAGIDEFFVDLSSHVYHILLQRYPDLLHREHESLDSLLPRPSIGQLNWHSDVLVGADAIEDCSVPVDWDDVALNIGAEVIRNLRQEIYSQLCYTCSGGIACNKVLAKLAAGRLKPNGQTVLQNINIPFFLSSYKVTKLRGLGGKLGQHVSSVFGTDRLSDLLPISLSVMQSKLGSESGQWVFRIIRGVDHSVVTPRTQIQSIMSQKTFSPSINGPEQAERWLRIFAADIMGRLEDQEGRRPTTLTVNHHIRGRFGPTRSKQVAIPRGASLDLDHLVVLMKNVLQKIADEGPAWPCLALSVVVSNFEDTETASRSIRSFYMPVHGHAAGFEPIRSERMLEDEEVLDPPNSFEGEAESSPSAPERQMDDASTPKPESNGEGTYPCPDCKQLVPARDVLEHLDWHVAKAFLDQP